MYSALGTWLALPPWGSEIPPLLLVSASPNSQQQWGQTHLSHKGEFELGYREKRKNTVTLLKKVSKHPPLSD